jgi:hypothetical protein
MARVIERDEEAVVATGATAAAVKAPSELRQWPVQLHLVPPTAPYFKDAELLVCADCVAFAMGDMHADLLKRKALAIACPKLDDTGPYVEKLAKIIQANDTPKVTVAIMEVPCCRGLQMLAAEAVKLSGRKVVLETVTIGIDGNRRT